MSSNLGQVCVVLGAQWGDEGKGKLVDILAEKYDIVARATEARMRGTLYILLPESSFFIWCRRECFIRASFA